MGLFIHAGLKLTHVSNSWSEKKWNDKTWDISKKKKNYDIEIYFAKIALSYPIGVLGFLKQFIE